MAKNPKNTDNSKFWQACGTIVTLTADGNVKLQPFWKRFGGFLEKLAYSSM